MLTAQGNHPCARRIEARALRRPERRRLTYSVPTAAFLRVRPTRPLRPTRTPGLKFSPPQPLRGSWKYGELDVSTKITGYQNRPVQVGAEKSAGRSRDAVVDAAAKAAPASPVRITEQARQLAALEAAVQSAPIIDELRVAAIRQAIEEGSYEVSPERIADKLLQMDQDLSTAEK